MRLCISVPVCLPVCLCVCLYVCPSVNLSAVFLPSGLNPSFYKLIGWFFLSSCYAKVFVKKVCRNAGRVIHVYSNKAYQSPHKNKKASATATITITATFACVYLSLSFFVVSAGCADRSALFCC